MTRDGIERALDNLPRELSDERSDVDGLPRALPSAAPVVEPGQAEDVVVTAGTAIVLYKIHVAQRAAEGRGGMLWRIAAYAAQAIQTLRAMSLMGALLIAMVAGGMVGTTAGIWMGMLAMIGGALALGGTSLFVLQVAELFVFRGLARRA